MTFSTWHRQIKRVQVISIEKFVSTNTWRFLSHLRSEISSQASSPSMTGSTSSPTKWEDLVSDSSPLCHKDVLMLVDGYYVVARKDHGGKDLYAFEFNDPPSSAPYLSPFIEAPKYTLVSRIYKFLISVTSSACGNETFRLSAWTPLFNLFPAQACIHYFLPSCIRSVTLKSFIRLNMKQRN